MPQVQQIFPFELRMDAEVLKVLYFLYLVVLYVTDAIKVGFTEEDLAAGFPGLTQLHAFLAVCRRRRQERKEEAT